MKAVKIIASLAIGSMIFIACKQNKYDDADELCQIILKMHEDDQKYREMSVDPFFEILDSIKESEDIVDVYNTFSEEKQLAYGRIARAIADKQERKFTEKQKDSLMQLQILIDNSNTELLIDIVKERGFPNLPECKGDKFPSIVFRHSQSEYWEEIRPLIQKEFEKGNMDAGQFKIVMNHINGREDYKITKKKIDEMDLLKN